MAGKWINGQYSLGQKYRGKIGQIQKHSIHDQMGPLYNYVEPVMWFANGSMVNVLWSRSTVVDLWPSAKDPALSVEKEDRKSLLKIDDCV